MRSSTSFPCPCRRATREHSWEFSSTVINLYATKCFEIGGGLILLSGRFTPLGLTLLGPVIVNILFFDIFLDSTGLPLGIIVAALALFLLWQNRSAFAGILRK